MTATAIPHVNWNEVLPPEILTVNGPNGIKIVVDISLFMSNHKCVYGEGCKGTVHIHAPLDQKAKPESGCCATGPYFMDPEDSGVPGDDNTERIRKWVEDLTPDDAENYDEIQKGWFTHVKEDGVRKARVNQVGFHCIFQNTTPGKSGCALHGKALKDGRNVRESKPMTCSNQPINMFPLDRGDDPSRFFLSARPHWYLWERADDWWCFKDKEAFVGEEPAFEAWRGSIENLLQYLPTERLTHEECGQLAVTVLAEMESYWEDRKAYHMKTWGTPQGMPAQPSPVAVSYPVRWNKASRQKTQEEFTVWDDLGWSRSSARKWISKNFTADQAEAWYSAFAATDPEEGSMRCILEVPDLIKVASEWRGLGVEEPIPGWREHRMGLGQLMSDPEGLGAIPVLADREAIDVAEVKARHAWGSVEDELAAARALGLIE